MHSHSDFVANYSFTHALVMEIVQRLFLI